MVLVTRPYLIVWNVDRPDKECALPAGCFCCSIWLIGVAQCHWCLEARSYRRAIPNRHVRARGAGIVMSRRAFRAYGEPADAAPLC